MLLALVTKLPGELHRQKCIMINGSCHVNVLMAFADNPESEIKLDSVQSCGPKCLSASRYRHDQKLWIDRSRLLVAEMYWAECRAPLKQSVPPAKFATIAEPCVELCFVDFVIQWLGCWV